MKSAVPLQLLPPASVAVGVHANEDALQGARLAAFSEFNSALAPIGGKLLHLDGCIQSPSAAELKRLRIAGNLLRAVVGEAAFAERLLMTPGAIADLLWNSAFPATPTEADDRRAA